MFFHTLTTTIPWHCSWIDNNDFHKVLKYNFSTVFIEQQQMCTQVFYSQGLVRGIHYISQPKLVLYCYINLLEMKSAEIFMITWKRILLVTQLNERCCCFTLYCSFLFKTKFQKIHWHDLFCVVFVSNNSFIISEDLYFWKLTTASSNNCWDFAPFLAAIITFAFYFVFLTVLHIGTGNALLFFFPKPYH